jgi:magnesium transporter
MDAFGSIISNNLNIIMKVLASLTLIMSIPTIISGYYGMNMKGPVPFFEHMWFPFMLSAALMTVCWFWLKKKDML